MKRTHIFLHTGTPSATGLGGSRRGFCERVGGCSSVARRRQIVGRPPTFPGNKSSRSLGHTARRAVRLFISVWQSIIAGGPGGVQTGSAGFVITQL